MKKVKHFFVDLHIHIGRTLSGKPVKITAAKTLTLDNIINYASNVKGMQMVGVIDCHNQEVISEIKEKLDKKEAIEQLEGGIVFREGITLIPGVELEINDENSQGPLHILGFFPHVRTIEAFANWLKGRVKNPSLSSQRVYESGRVLQRKIKELGGLFIPAHVFTPHKSLYGSGVVNSLKEVFDPTLIDAVELGLSSNTGMADQMEELRRYPYLSNSDAHSLEKIGREYQVVKMEKPTFQELEKAIKEIDGRAIVANYGLDPELGKYYFTSCEKCTKAATDDERSCSYCGHKRLIKGVYQRIKELSMSAQAGTISKKRPPYIHQVPLEFIPKLGPKTLQKLRSFFQTDMSIMHQSKIEELEKLVSPAIAKNILKGREGMLTFEKGGAGRYGKIKE